MPHQRKIVHCTLFFAVSLQNKLHFICPRSLPAHFRHPHRTLQPMSTTHIPSHARRPTCAASLFQYPHRTPLHPSRASTARHFTFLLISCLPIPFSLPIHRSHQSRSPRTLSKLVYHTAATASPFQHPRHRCPARHALPSASSPM